MPPRNPLTIVSTIKSPEIARGIADGLKAGLLPKVEHEGNTYHAVAIHETKDGEEWTVVLDPSWST